MSENSMLSLFGDSIGLLVLFRIFSGALETFNALGIQFVSLSEQVDTSTPTGKMVFTVLGAGAELERNLIVERVRVGLRHARAKGKRLGRPRKPVDAAQIISMRAEGESWRKISRKIDLSVGTVFAAAQTGDHQSVARGG
jgi:DNA invertase Pin-like site-specific DNA recombinase